MTWRTAKCIEVLRAEVDAAHPDRPKTADGIIGDLRHQATKSDHNPNAAGVVTAWDITTADFTITLAESLRRLGEAGDKRVKYVIYRGKIAGPTNRGWKWRPYSGFSQHFDHIHLSVSGVAAQYDRTDPWFPLPKPAAKKPPAPKPPAPTEGDDVTPEDIEKIAQRVKQLVAQDLAVLLHGTRDGTHPANLDNIWKAVAPK